MSCEDYPTKQTAKTFKLDAETVNEVVTSSDDRTNQASDGLTKKTLAGIENDATSQLADIQQRADDQYSDINNQYVLRNKGDYATDPLLEFYYEFTDNSGLIYFPIVAPYQVDSTTYPDPSNDPNLRLGQATDDSLITSTGSTTPRRLDDRFADVVSVKDFGAVGDGVTDDSDAIKDALDYAQSLSPDAGWKGQMPEITFPKGVYVVAKGNHVFSDLRYARLRVKGAGPRATVLKYTQTSASGEYMMNSTDQNTGYCKFTGIGFLGNDNGGGWFFYSASNGNAQNWKFEDCEFRQFDRLFNFDGSANDSENTWTDCKITTFDHASAEYIFRFSNQQAVNQRFFGTDIETFNCDLFHMVSGTSIKFFGGSIIPDGSDANIFHVPADASPGSFGQSNKPTATMNCVRYEMKGNSRLFYSPSKDQNDAMHIIHNSSNMGGLNMPTTSEDPTYYPIEFKGGSVLTFNDCSNLQNYRMKHEAVGTAASTTAPELLFNRCTMSPLDFFTNSDVTIPVGGSNTDRQPLVTLNKTHDSYNGTFVLTKTGGVTTPKDGGVNFSSRPTRPTRVVYFTQSLDQEVHIAPSVVKSIRLTSLSSSAYGTQEITITVWNADKTVQLGQTTFNSNERVLSREVLTRPTFVNPFVGSGPDTHLIFEWSSTYANLMQIDGDIVIEH
ncbi:pectin lyase fold/virulence factor [Vibrio phage 1.266.O._10N.286.52.F9]|nr:pectin lyase fold/virulence factor [Vibrio phage 1.266.O._10N.286.52.F9]